MNKHARKHGHEWVTQISPPMGWRGSMPSELNYSGWWPHLEAPVWAFLESRCFSGKKLAAVSPWCTKINAQNIHFCWPTGAKRRAKRALQTAKWAKTGPLARECRLCGPCTYQGPQMCLKGTWQTEGIRNMHLRSSTH